jgi:RNA polymerase sigma-70 factor (ECF subfamily)
MQQKQELTALVPWPMDTSDWLQRFHAGQKQALQECYQEHFDTVFRAAGEILSGADQETLVHEVFYRLISDKAFRLKFSGGSFRAWIRTVTRNRAIDFVRKHRRERLVDPEVAAQLKGGQANRTEEETAAKLLIERFKNELPQKWHSVFEARFLVQLSQREAARELKMRRTTLAYQELQIRKRLRRFLLRLEEQ